jgi:general secretion pathway protein K
MKRFLSSHKTRQASALLLSLWALTVLSFAILGAASIINIRLDESIAREREARAFQLALSGVSLAMHPNVNPGESILKKEISPGESFAADVSNEGARIQINYILADIKNRRTILSRLFNFWGIAGSDADTIIDCLADWYDSDDNRRLNGAEKTDYVRDNPNSTYPANSPFESVDQMALVKNIGLLETAKPDWRDYFTVWSDGKIDINEASAEVIAATLNTSLGQAQNLVNRRNGQDGQPHTTDDVKYSDTNQVRIALGMTEEVFQSVSSRVTVSSKIKRITSIGKVGPYQKTISAILRINNQTIQIYEWLEQ